MVNKRRHVLWLCNLSAVFSETGNAYAFFHRIGASGGGGVLPFMRYIGIWGPKRYGFPAVLVINRESILANFGHFGHKWGMVFELWPIWECF